MESKKESRPTAGSARRAVVLILAAFLVVGLSMAQWLRRPSVARAQDAANQADAAGDGTQSPADVLAPVAPQPNPNDIAGCQSARQAYEDTLPVPSPTPGTAPFVGFVVQLVNESNQVLLAAADAAGVRNPPNSNNGLIPVLPREGSWVMQPFGTKLTWPDGTPQNTLTIDIPQGWENTVCGTSHGSGPVKVGCVGPLFWARTGCTFDVANNIAQCETGDCSGNYDCSKAFLTGIGPRTFTEWTFGDQANILPNGIARSAPDISVVDGASINVDIEPIGPSEPSAVPNGQNANTWLGFTTASTQPGSPSNLPLVQCGEDLRTPSACPVGGFQLLRNQLGMFVKCAPGSYCADKNDPNGTDLAACFSNCGFYEFLGGNDTSPTAPCPGFRCPGVPASNCDPATDITCYNHRTFCCFVAEGDPQKIYSTGCTAVDPGMPSPPSQCPGHQNAECWSARPLGPDPGTCSCAGVIKTSPCPSNVCTNQWGPAPANVNQPPFLTCAQIAANAPGGQGSPSQCIGDDTIHTVMPRGLTWPNDPETYFSDAKAYRIVFAPGAFAQGSQVPAITPSGPVPLCSELPTAYGYSIEYGGPNSGSKDCDNEVNKNGAQFAGAVLNPGTGPGQHLWACRLGPGVPANGFQVLCRWHAASPTATPTSSGSPTSTPTPTPTPTSTPTGGGGTPTPTLTPTATPTATPTPGTTTVFEGTSIDVHTGPGQTVINTFTATNTTTTAESISTLTIELSNPKLFQALTLSNDDTGQDGEGVDTPANTNTFTFSPAISLPAGATTSFTLTTTVSFNPKGKGAMNFFKPTLTGVAYAAAVGDAPDADSSSMPWSIALLAGFALLAMTIRSRRLVLVGGAMILLVAIGGCGGGGSSGSGGGGQPSSNVSVTGAGTQGPTSGLPLQMFHITSSKK